MSRRETQRSNRERADELARGEKERLEKERQQRVQDEEDLGELLKSPKARRYLSSLIRRTKIYSDASSTNANVYREIGRRDVGLWILRDIKRSAEQHLNEFLGESFND